MTQPTHGDVADDASRIARILRMGTVRSGLELFAAYGIYLSQAPKGTANDGDVADVAFFSVAGFCSPHFSGFVVLGTTEHMLRRSNSTNSSPGDWMAELGNQFLGRIKNQLLKEGISISRVPPAVMTGCGPSLVYARTGQTPLTLTDDEDTVFIWMESEPALEASSIALQPDTDVLAEGEMVLF